MKYTAVLIIGRNTFLRFELENHDDTEDEVIRDAEELAARLGARFLYLESTL